MSIAPIITFKAGACDFDTSSSPPKVTPKATPGYLYLYEEDDLIHFCWRPRSVSMSQPDLELVMVPSDGNFVPYKESTSESSTKSPTNGRIFVLKFHSSTQRHLFWMQSKSQHAQGDPAWFSPRDLKLGEIVDRLLQGDQVNVSEEVANVSNNHGGSGGDEDMEDVRHEGSGNVQGNIGSGDPFMSDTENEGSGPRDGGADGGRAANEASTAVQNFLRSMQGNQTLNSRQTQTPSHLFTTLPDLLPTSETIPMVEGADVAFVDRLLSHLPSVLLLQGQEADSSSSAEPNAETTDAAMKALSLDQKKEILKKVLRSPQFTQSLGSLTSALRDGGLPTIGDALKIPAENGGYIKGGGVPLGGGDAVEAFMNGVKKCVADKGEEAVNMRQMDTD